MSSGVPENIIQLGKNIRRFRKALGMNQTDLALLAKTQITTISLLENGQNKNPGWDLLQRLADALNTTIHELALPQTSDLHANPVVKQFPPGLMTLIEKQDQLLAPKENRISLDESNWLQHVPDPDCRLISTDFLLILRQFRHLQDV